MNTKLNVTKTIDFMKMHYEYILPFSFLFFVLTLFLGFISAQFKLIMLLLILPLTLSVPYFVHKIEQGSQKKFGLFFEVYNSFFKFVGANVLKSFIIVVILSPMFYLMADVMEQFNFDENKLKLALENKSFVPSKNLSITTFICIFLVLFSLPYILFVEYFAVLGDKGIGASFKHAYHLGSKYYFPLILLLIVQFSILTLGTILTCGFVFLIAFPFFNILYYYIYKQFRIEHAID
jgi:hypothetical protein